MTRFGTLLARVALLPLLLPALTLADGAGNLPVAEIVDRLQAGGHIIYLRHAATDHDAKDRDSGELRDCDRQRNLSARGRAQARRIGAAIRALDIPIGEVQSSPYCRCRDTAELAFGRYQRNMKLQFSIKKDREESELLGEQLRQMMRAADLGQGNAVFVGHTSNLRDGLGIWPKPEAVAMVFRRDGDDLRFLGRVEAEEWPLPELTGD